MTRCTATSKRSGERCGAQAITGRQVCRHHGGRSLAGPASPAWIHGGYSDVLPTRLLDRFRAAAGDPDLLALRNEIALIDARKLDVLDRVETGESGAVWTELSTAVDSLQEAARTANLAGVTLWMTELRRLVDRGLGDAAAWAEVMDLVERRRRVVDSERKRETAMRQMLTAEEAMALAAALQEAVRANVRDPDTLAAISATFIRLVSRPDGGGSGAAGGAAA